MNDPIDPQTSGAAAPRGDWRHWLLHRWPTALGIAVALLTTFDLQIDRTFFAALAAIIAFMALVYLGPP